MNNILELKKNKMKIIISVCRGIIECEDVSEDVEIELHDYDINEIENDNPDRRYGHDLLGDYEITIL